MAYRLLFAYPFIRPKSEQNSSLLTRVYMPAIRQPRGRARASRELAAEGEYQAAVKLGQAADIITEHPVALQLRTLQTMAEILVEKNSTIIFLAHFMTTVREAVRLLPKDSASK